MATPPPNPFRPLPPHGLSPLEAAGRLAGRPGVVFFDSAVERGGALSVLAARPSEVLCGQSGVDWERLRQRLARKKEETRGRLAPPGLAAGWVEYGGAFCFAFYDSALVFRHGEGWSGSLPPDALAALAAERPATPPTPGVLPHFCHATGREAFVREVERAQEYIAAGDIYQVNLSHRFSAPWPEGLDAWAFYRALRQASPAPYAAWLELEGRRVLSTSPELFLKIGGRRILTRPIKGTRPRHAEPGADAGNAEELLASPKERAELIMITDLERNDLGKVCEFGSVRAEKLLELEAFAQVFHLVSTVEGRLRPEVDAVTALRACFPGGSITGAPKKRAMEIIAELEGRERGLYTGAIGWFGYDGSAQFNIAIRTLVIENGTAHFDVGAGIVADSIPAAEWQETLDKAAGILRAANPHEDRINEREWREQSEG